MPNILMPDGTKIPIGDISNLSDTDLNKLIDAVSSQTTVESQKPDLNNLPPVVNPNSVSSPGDLSGTIPSIDLGAMINNIPGDFINVGSNILSGIIHPLNTATGIGNIALGGIKKIVRGVGMEPTSGAPNAEPSFDAFANMLKEKYGGLPNIVHTVQNEPVSSLMDLSTIASAGSGLLGKVGEISKLGTLSKVGEITGDVGKTIEPISAIIKTLGAITPDFLTPERIAERLYESSLKQSTSKSLTIAQRTANAKTGLLESIMPTEKGYAKLQDIIDKTNEDIANIINEAKNKGDTVSTLRIASRLDDLKPFYEKTLDPQPFIQDLDELKQRFSNAHPVRIPVDDAQQIKRNTYTLLKKQYGEMKSINIEGQKNLARGIKEELASKYPELSILNSKESSLIELDKVITAAVKRITNRDILSIGMKVSSATGAAISGNGRGLIAGLTAGLVDTPTIKAALAIALNKAAIINKLSPHPSLNRNLFQIGRAANSITDIPPDFQGPP